MIALRALRYEINLLKFPFSLMIWPALSKISSSYTNLFVTLKTFGEGSGFKINNEKTEVLALGNSRSPWKGHSDLLNLNVLVPADKAGNNIIFVCKYYYIHTLMEELGINSGTNLNSTYNSGSYSGWNNTDPRHNIGGCIWHQTTTEEKTCHRYIGFLNFTRHHIGKDLLQVQAHAQWLGFLN